MSPGTDVEICETRGEVTVPESSSRLTSGTVRTTSTATGVAFCAYAGTTVLPHRSAPRSTQAHLEVFFSQKKSRGLATGIIASTLSRELTTTQQYFHAALRNNSSGTK
jgi:hypothetical protein